MGELTVLIVRVLMGIQIIIVFLQSTLSLQEPSALIGYVIFALETLLSDGCAKVFSDIKIKEFLEKHRLIMGTIYLTQLV